MINGRKSAKTGTLAGAARGQRPETPHRLEGENRNLRGPLAIFANRCNNEQSQQRSTAHRAEADLFTSAASFRHGFYLDPVFSVFHPAEA